MTTTDLVIPAGETVGFVKIKSTEAGAVVNNYGTGDINIRVKPFSYIKSVVNINGVSGGADEESDENYLKRILLAPEGFSCAGSRMAYIYHALSAHPSIVDAQVEAPQIPASIEVGGEIFTEENGVIDGGEGFNAIVDYKTGTIVLNAQDVEYTITIPPQSTVNVYPLTQEDNLSEVVIQAVDDKLNGELNNPMCDVVQVLATIKTTKEITLNAVIGENFDKDITKSLIEDIAQEFKSYYRKKLNAEIVPSQFISKIGAIEGVYSCDCGDLQKISARINEYFDLDFTINVIQKGAV
jgi:phage-related baseplate assembly protein